MQRVLKMNYKIGFIGCGNMASAIISGLINKAEIEPLQIIASDASKLALDNISDKFGIHTTSDNKKVAKEAEVVFLAVKPQFYESVIDEIKGLISEEQIIVTIAPGKTTEVFV